MTQWSSWLFSKYSILLQLTIAVLKFYTQPLMLLHYIMYITAGLTIPHIWGASKTTSLAHWSRAIFFFILYKQIEELQNFRSWASENFEKRRALDTGMTQDYGSVPNFCQSICPKQTTMEEEWDFFQDFLQFYVYDLRFKAGGLTTFFFLSFEQWLWQVLEILPHAWQGPV